MGKLTIRKASKKALVRFLNLLLIFSLFLSYFTLPKDVFAVVNIVTPSTNEINKTNNWAHVNEIASGIEEITLQFVSSRGFLSCFEYRLDGDVSEKTSDTNYNNGVTDGLYPFYCLSNNSKTVTFNPKKYIEIRMVFGAERDERFDWTRFDVLAKPTTPVLESPIDGTYTNDNTPLMQWDDSTVIGGTIKEYFYRIYHHCTDTSNIPGSCSVWPNPTGLPGNISEYQAGTTADGEYYWQVKAVDDIGTESDWSELEKFVIDTKAPSTPEVLGYKDPITQCKGYTNVKNSTVDWSDSDGTGSPIKGYEYQINYPLNGGRELWTPFFATTNSQNSGSLNEGRHYVRVRAQDMAGNWSAWSQDWVNPANLTEEEKDANCSIEYDSIDPTTPTGLHFWDVDNNNAVQCGGYSNTKHIKEYWDSVLDINFLRYEYSSFNAPSGTAGLVQSPLTTNFFDSSWWMIPREGTYGFQVRALDKAGNVSGWALNNSVGIQNSCTINIDWTPPVVEITNPSDNGFVKGIVDFRGTVTDINLLRYYYFIENTTSKTVTTDTNLSDETVYTWNTALKPDGLYELRLEARDKANNKDNNLSIDSIHVTVDNTLPLLSEVEDITLEDEQAIPLAVVTTTETNINQLCFTLEGPLGNYSESCIDITGNFDVISTILNNYGKSALTHVDTDLLPIGKYTLNYYVTDKAGNESSDHEFVLTIVEKLVGLENAQQEVLGTQTTNGGTQRNTRATIKSVTRITELLGIGGPEEDTVLSEDNTTNPEVKGVNECQDKKTISGYVYMDINNNGEKENNEKLLKDIEIRIYTKTDNSEETIEKVKTDEEGYWETKVCEGEYFIEINTESLPNNTSLDSNVKSVSITADTTESTIDFGITDTRNFIQKYWPWLLLGVVSVGLISFLFVTNRNKKEL